MQPRDYQNACHEYLWNGLHSRPAENPLVVMPTGTGKSLQMAMFYWGMLSSYPRLRMLNVTHVKELVEGNYETLLKVWPEAPAGVYSSGLGRKDSRSQITFCGIQSVAKRAATFGHIDFVLVDEAHRISNAAATSYGKFINDLRKVNPHLIVIGFTATPFRMGSGLLVDGALFDYTAFDLSDGEAFIWLINNGYLIKPVPKDPGFQFDESSVHLRGGEYVDSEASAAMHDQGILERAVDVMIQTAMEDHRKSMLTFCQSIDDAELVADMFRYKGVPVEAVHSGRNDRDDVLAKFKRGELWGVTNKDVLTTGFDHPPIDLIGMLRLTRSPSLWVQMLGRGTRPHWAPGSYHGGLGHNGGPPLDGLYDIATMEGRIASISASSKQNCKVLDFVGNTLRLGTINYPVVPNKRRKGSGEAPARKCPQCSTYHHCSVKVCTEELLTLEGVKICGYEFPPPASHIGGAGSMDLVTSVSLDLTQQPPPRVDEVHGVHRMVCSYNEGKNGRTDTMRVDYFCGYSKYSKWICFEHDIGSGPRKLAERWWSQHNGEGDAPYFVDDALELSGTLTKPKFIKVRTGGKYPDIIGFDFEGTRFELHPSAGGPPLSDPGPDPMAAFHEQSNSKTAEAMKSMSGYDDDIPF